MSTGTDTDTGTDNPPPPIWDVIEAAKAMIAEPYAGFNVIKALRRQIDRLTPEDITRIDMLVAHWAGYAIQIRYTIDDLEFNPGTDSEPTFWWAATIAAMLEHGGVSGGQPVNFPLFVSTVVAVGDGIGQVTEFHEANWEATRFSTLFRLAVESILAGCVPDCLPEYSHPDANFAAGLPRVFAPASRVSVDDTHLAILFIENFRNDYPHAFDISDAAPGVRFPEQIDSRWLMAYQLIGWLTPPDVVHAVLVHGMSSVDALTIAGMSCQVEALGSVDRDEWRALAAEMLELAAEPVFQIIVLPAVII